jgi:hypothetical protein
MRGLACGYSPNVHQRHAGIHGGDDIHHLGVAIFFVMQQAGIIQRFCRTAIARMLQP